MNNNVNYLPVKVLKREYAERLLQGEVHMKTQAQFAPLEYQKTEEQKKELIQGVRQDIGEGIECVIDLEKDPYGFYSGMPDDMKKHILSACYINDNRETTRLYCMTKLEYDESHNTYIPLDDRIGKGETAFGDTAVIILKPAVFFERLAKHYAMTFSDTYEIAASEIQYKNIFKDMGEWGIFAKEEGFQWQKEVRIAAMLRRGIISTRESDFCREYTANIGDISDICCMVPVEDLIEGRFPEEALQQDILEQMTKAHEPPKGLTTHNVSVSGNFLAIAPTKEWIQPIQKILPESEWNYSTIMEQLAPGAEPIPRLGFFHKDKRLRVLIYSQRILVEMEEQNACAVKYLLDVLACIEHAGLHTAYNSAVEMTVWNLGNIDSTFLMDKSNYYVQFSRMEKGYQYFFCLNEGKMQVSNIFGYQDTLNQWQFIMRIEKPVQNGSLYDINEIEKQFDYMEQKRNQRIEVFKEGDIFERFSDL